MTAEDYIYENYGSNWLKNEWQSGDVIDALNDFASQREIEITAKYSQSLPSEEEIKDLYLIRNYFGDHDKTTFEHFAYSFLNRLLSRLQPSGNSEQLKDIS